MDHTGPGFNVEPNMKSTDTGQHQTGKKTIWVHCNVGKRYNDEVGTLEKYVDVELCQGGIANILSLARSD